MRLATSSAAALLLCACAVQKEIRPSPTRRSVPLLEATAEQETSARPEQRADIEIETSTGRVHPAVIATAETGLLRLEGARARLYGDADGTTGWSVDNVVLLEILDRAGTVRGRAAAGFSGPMFVGREPVDSVGRMSFTLGPGEVDITSAIPESEPFRIRATALDDGGVGRVSDVFLVLEPPQRATEEDLRGQ